MNLKIVVTKKQKETLAILQEKYKKNGFLTQEQKLMLRALKKSVKKKEKSKKRKMFHKTR